MKIHVSIPQTIELTREQMIKITLETIKKLFDIPEHAYINDEGTLIKWIDTHGSGIEEGLRKATIEDKKALDIIELILKKQKWIKEYPNE